MRRKMIIMLNRRWGNGSCMTHGIKLKMMRGCKLLGKPRQEWVPGTGDEKVRINHRRCSVKKVLLKTSHILQEIPVLESVFNKVAGVQLY